MAYVPSREAERLLGVCANTLRKWADAGEINHIKTPFGQRRYDVETFIGEHQDSAAKIIDGLGKP